MNEGVNFNEEREKRRREEEDFSDLYTEHHAKTQRVNRAPADGEVIPESRVETFIQSDGERGRIVTLDHTEYIRCDCGCLAEGIEKTRRDRAGNVYCEKHANLYCSLCSLLIMAETQVKVAGSFYHRSCGVKVIDRILDADALHPKLSPSEIGELKAIRSSIAGAAHREGMEKAFNYVKGLFRRKKRWLSKGEKMKDS